jgi:hypothetical protein
MGHFCEDVVPKAARSAAKYRGAEGAFIIKWPAGPFVKAA